ncbi:MAG: hypothetical protein VB144_13670 [Clostridia bacterium]|nr:hypothetical protein [Clostridia bacterium]
MEMVWRDWRRALVVLASVMAVLCGAAQPASAALCVGGRGGGLLPEVLSMAVAGHDAQTSASGPVGSSSAFALSRPSYTGLSLDAGLSSNFTSALPVAREAALSLTGRPQRKSALKRLAKHLPDDFAEDIARIEISGSSSVALAWGSAIRFELGEEVIAEGVASGDTVRWLAELRQGSDAQHAQKRDCDYEIGVWAKSSTVQKGTISVSTPIAASSGRGRGAIGLSLSVIRGRSLYDANLAGVAQEMPDGKGKLVGTLEKIEWDESRGGALGFAIDIAGAVALSDHVSVGMCLRNAVGMVTWKDALFVRGIVNTDTVTVDEHGYLVYAPTMTGVQHLGDWRQILPRALEAGLEANCNGARVVARLYYDGQRLLPSAKVALDPNAMRSDANTAWHSGSVRLPWLELGCRLTPAIKCVWHARLEDQDGKWSVSLGADRLNLSAAEALAASMEFMLGF